MMWSQKRTRSAPLSAFVPSNFLRAILRSSRGSSLRSFLPSQSKSKKVEMSPGPAVHQPREIAAAVVVEHHQLAIQNESLFSKRLQLFDQMPMASRNVAATAGEQAGRSAIAHGD